MLDDEAFRERLRELLGRTGLSQRALSGAFGRDPGYVQALLDATRPSRARPTPEDLLRASAATGVPFAELLELLWDVPLGRLAEELTGMGSLGQGAGHAVLGAEDRRSLADYAAFLASRHRARRAARAAGRRSPGG